jgi:hypothetical protein
VVELFYDFNQLSSVFLLLRFLLEFSPSSGLSVKHFLKLLPNEVDKLYEFGATKASQNVFKLGHLRTRLATVTHPVDGRLRGLLLPTRSSRKMVKR